MQAAAILEPGAASAAGGPSTPPRAVNDELGALQRALPAAVDCLAPGGSGSPLRLLLTVCFHS